MTYNFSKFSFELRNFQDKMNSEENFTDSEDIDIDIDDESCESIDNSYIERLWKSRRTMLEVAFDRGFLEAESKHMTFEEFESTFSDRDYKSIKEDIELKFEKSSGEKIIILWPKEPKLGTNIREIKIKMDNLEIKIAIIVVDNSVTSWCEGTIRSLRSQGYLINVYTLEESQFNIMKHKYVPKHEICSLVEKKQIIKDYNLKSSQIPGIKLSDVTVRHLGAVRGQLIKITRKSETQLDYDYITYRIVN